MREGLNIAGQEIGPGESSIVDISVSRLPSGTRINIKAHVYCSERPGPTLLLLGGVHGDEINGIEIVRRAIDYGALSHLQRGNVIAISLLNVYGFINFNRDVPDGKDVNRSFPGTATGSLASRVAATLTKTILPHVDFAIDFHTGGASRYNYPQIRYSKTDEGARELAKVFAAPYVIQKTVIPKSFRKTANEMQVPVIVYEGGESERLCGYSIESGYDGILRVLHHLQMRDSAPAPKHRSIHATKTGWVRASDAGLFTWTRQSGIMINKGEPLGVINSPQGDRTKKIISKRSGHIIGHNNASVVHHGDALFHIAYDHEYLD